ncbi:MAG: glycosyltransferase family 2 protein [Flavobacteriales bacterium]|nr:glycosyltransferase family 2 protein [Flavobacteriales bacterium]
METQKIKIAVVILNWNGKHWLEKFLPNVIQHSNDAEVIIADNNSSDDSIKFLEENYPNIRIIQNDGNYGYAKGYNLSLKQINAEYFVLLNSDIEVTKYWISPIISLMDSDRTISACQPKILDYNNKNKFEYAGASGGFIDNLGYPFCRGRIFDYLEEDKGQYNDTTEIFWATGACLFVRASHFFEINGLDEDFFAHQEEIDLCWRFKNKGYKVFVEPKSKVYHVGGGTLNVDSPYKTHLNFRNNLYMLFKNLPLSSLFKIIPIRLILDGVAALTFINKEKGIKHIKSIVKAHFYFYSQIPNLLRKRKYISQKNNLTGKMKWSVLVKSKMRRIKEFSKF